MLRIGEFSKLAQVSVKTLRHYDHVGLLAPAWIDRYNGYRYYQLSQLSTLHSILALKELGFSLEHIQKLLQEDLPQAELRGMMRMKQAELEARIQQDQTRLSQIEMHLARINSDGCLPAYDVVIKPVQARQIVGLRRVIPSVAQLAGLYQVLHQTLASNKLPADPTLPMVTVYYDTEFQDYGLDVEVAVPAVGKIAERQNVVVHTLPAVPEMACVLYQGSLDGVHFAHQAVIRWVESNGYRITSPNRDVFLQGAAWQEGSFTPDDIISEVQYPVERKPVPMFIQKQKESNLMEPKIKKKEAFTVVGVKYQGKNENNEIAKMWGEVYESFSQIKHVITPPDICFGLCGEMLEDGSFSYLAGLPVSEAAGVPEGMEVWEVPAREYVVLPCTLSKIGETYEYAFSTWLPENGYKRDTGPDFELYEEDFDIDDSESILYIYIPIKK